MGNVDMVIFYLQIFLHLIGETSISQIF